MLCFDYKGKSSAALFTVAVTKAALSSTTNNKTETGDNVEEQVKDLPPALVSPIANKTYKMDEFVYIYLPRGIFKDQYNGDLTYEVYG